MSRPAPLVPAEVDLRDFAFMPLDVDRLRDSDFAAKTKPAGFRSGLLLWCASWHQIPAGSLPLDEDVLAKLAGFGYAVKEWALVRDDALRGWILCSDDRLYHPVIAEKALDAWQAKLKQRHKTAMAAAKKHCERIEVQFRQMPFETWIELGRPELQELYRHWDKRDLSPGQEPPVTGTDGGPSPGQGPSVPRLSPEIPIQGTGRGTGTGTGTDLKANPEAAASGAEIGRQVDPPSPPPLPANVTTRALDLVVLLRSKGCRIAPGNPYALEWAKGGVSDAQLLTAFDQAEERRQQKRDPNPINAGLVNAIVGDVLKKSPAIDFEALAKV